MKKLFALSFFVTSLLAVGCAETNQEACIEYVADVERVYEQCDRESQLNADEECPESLNDPEAGDCAGYFECLAESYTCNQGVVEWDTAGCTCA